MPEVFPIATLVDTSIRVDVLAAVCESPPSGLEHLTHYDLAVLNEIAAQCGKTYRGAALARAYLEGRE